VWLGLTLSYTFPTLPPSSMIVASAVGIYVLAVAAHPATRASSRSWSAKRGSAAPGPGDPRC
jgi:hypothetical protein